MLNEIRESQGKKSMNSCLSNGSPGEIRTPVGGSLLSMEEIQSPLCLDANQSFVPYTTGLLREERRQKTVFELFY